MSNQPSNARAKPGPRFLTALPVYNEVNHVTDVLDEVVRNAGDVLVVDDGSSDGTRDLLARRTDVTVLSHSQNRGYGAALKTAFDYAVAHDYDVLVTGETTFHTCLEADARGVGLILAGHFASERFALLSLADYLTDQLSSISVWASSSERDPLRVV